MHTQKKLNDTSLNGSSLESFSLPKATTTAPSLPSWRRTAPSSSCKTSEPLTTSLTLKSRAWRTSVNALEKLAGQAAPFSALLTWQQDFGKWSCIPCPRTVTSMGQFQWVTSPMGLLGCHTSFQCLMETKVNGISNMIVYIDYLLVYSAKHEEHLAKLGQAIRKNYFQVKSKFWCTTQLNIMILN